MSDVSAVKLAEALANAMVRGERSSWDQLVMQHRDIPMTTLAAMAAFAGEPAIILGAQIRRLEKRIAELEARPQNKGAGVWSADVEYAQGDLVSHGGSGWIANWKSKGLVPGKNSGWSLFIQKGRDGKDAR